MQSDLPAAAGSPVLSTYFPDDSIVGVIIDSSGAQLPIPVTQGEVKKFAQTVISSVQTIEPVTPATPAVERARRTKKYQEFAVGGLDKLQCVVCLETVQFPISYPCQRHFGCHKCVHGMVDSRKQLQVPPTATHKPPVYVFPIKCPSCRSEDEPCTDSKLLKNLYPKIDTSMIAVVEMIQSLQAHTEPDMRMRLPLLDDVSCPYCTKSFNSTSGFAGRFSHLTSCAERKFHCSRCLKPVVDLQLHLLEDCATFECAGCGKREITWTELTEHQSRPEDTVIFTQQVSQAMAMAGQHPTISHNDDWKQVPSLVRKLSELMVLHRHDPEKVSTALTVLHTAQRELERLEEAWKGQAMAQPRSTYARAPPPRVDTSAVSVGARVGSGRAGSAGGIRRRSAQQAGLDSPQTGGATFPPAPRMSPVLSQLEHLELHSAGQAAVGRAVSAFRQ